MRVMTPLSICSISASLQVISELEASVRFLKPIRASSATTVLITRSPSRNAWWKEMVIPSCRPQRFTASSTEAQSLRLCFASASASHGVALWAVSNGFKPRRWGNSYGEVQSGSFCHPYRRTPEAAARSSTTCAWLIIGASTILPLSDTTPRPLRSPSSAASITRFACSTSSCVGA